MSKKDEALKLALEALKAMHEEGIRVGWHIHPKWSTGMENAVKAITALREALAEQPAKHLSGLDVYLDPGDGLKPKRYDPQPAQQEPVGTYGEIFESMRSLLRSGKQADQQIYMAMRDKPLYTSPPAQRTWVGLTDKEEVELWESTDSDWELMKRVEAKLKEKNT